MEQDQMEWVQWQEGVRVIAQDMTALASQEECQEAEEDLAEEEAVEEEWAVALEEDYLALPEDLEEDFLASGDQDMQNQHMSSMQSQQKKNKKQWWKTKPKQLKKSKKL